MVVYILALPRSYTPPFSRCSTVQCGTKLQAKKAKTRKMNYMYAIGVSTPSPMLFRRVAAAMRIIPML